LQCGHKRFGHLPGFIVSHAREAPYGLPHHAEGLELLRVVTDRGLPEAAQQEVGSSDLAQPGWIFASQQPVAADPYLCWLQRARLTHHKPARLEAIQGVETLPDAKQWNGVSQPEDRFERFESGFGNA
jgi:hypothetical protein